MTHYSRRIAVDFDGVIHRARQGKHDSSIYDEANEEVLEGMRDLLRQGYVVFVYSARESSEILEWMEKLYPWFGEQAAAEGVGFPVRVVPPEFELWNETNVLGITRKKFAALIYIDDHGFHFTGDWGASIQEFKRRRKLFE